VLAPTSLLSDGQGLDTFPEGRLDALTEGFPAEEPVDAGGGDCRVSGHGSMIAEGVWECNRVWGWGRLESVVCSLEEKRARGRGGSGLSHGGTENGGNLLPEA